MQINGNIKLLHFVCFDLGILQMVAPLLHQAMAGSPAPNVPPPIYGLISPVTAQEPSALDEINIMSNEDVQETIR